MNAQIQTPDALREQIARAEQAKAALSDVQNLETLKAELAKSEAVEARKREALEAERARLEKELAELNQKRVDLISDEAQATLAIVDCRAARRANRHAIVQAEHRILQIRSTLGEAVNFARFTPDRGDSITPVLTILNAKVAELEVTDPAREILRDVIRAVGATV